MSKLQTFHHFSHYYLLLIMAYKVFRLIIGYLYNEPEPVNTMVHDTSVGTLTMLTASDRY